MRSQAQVLPAAALGALLSGTPSVAHAVRTRGPAAAVGYALDATRAIGTLTPSGRPGLLRGAILHGAISLGVAELLAAVLPRRHRAIAGAGAGLAVGWVNLGVLAPRRWPALAALPLGPQLADNAAFGAIVGWRLDR